MKSPFNNRDENERMESAIVVQDSRTKEQIREELLKERVKLAHYYKEAGKGLFVATYLIIRSQMPISNVLEFIYIDKIVSIFGYLILVPSFISGAIIVLKELSNMIRYSANEKKFFGFLEYHLHVPFGYSVEKPKPIIPLKRLLLYMLYTEIAISSFFIIDYLFGL